MQIGVACQPSPEEEELAAKRAQCSKLQAELAERELCLVNLRASIAAFQGKYLRQVGVLYAELDEWNARITAQIADKERTENARSTTFREFTFEHLLSEHEKAYDAVLIDVSPSITLFQTCAMVYSQKMLIPVDMDVLSVQGATSSIQGAETLNGMLHKKGLDVRAIGILPIKVDRRLAMTDTVLNTLEDISEKRGVPLLPAIRTDQAVLTARGASLDS